MTVKELIERLKQFPEDVVVAVWSDDECYGGLYKAYTVEHTKLQSNKETEVIWLTTEENVYDDEIHDQYKAQGFVSYRSEYEGNGT